MATDTKSSLIRKKIMGLVCFFGRSFNHSKCKTKAKLAVSRIKLLRNKREEHLRQMRRDIASLLQSKQDDTARIRVEHLIREQNVMAANEIIDLFCELIVVRLPIIAKQKECPVDLKEGIASLIYAAPRCSEIPELQSISDLFLKKYGKEFVSAAKELRPQSGVNRQLIKRLSDKNPSGEVKLKVMKEIAEEYKIDWDMTSSEEELLKPPEELIAGPRSFASASDMRVKSHVPYNHTEVSSTSAVPVAKSSEYLASQSSVESNNSSVTKNNTSMNLKKLSDSQSFHASSTTAKYDKEDITDLEEGRIVRNNKYAARGAGSDIMFDDSDGLDSDEEENIKINGRHNINNNNNGSLPPPPNRPAPMVPCRIVNESESRRTSTSSVGARVHPKLPPDYDSFAAHFDSLKSNRR